VAPLTPFDRDAYNASHPAPAVWAVRKRHGVSIAKRIAVSVVVLAVCGAVWIGGSIAADWLSSGGAR
jgi:hypothetical protein